MNPRQAASDRPKALAGTKSAPSDPSLLAGIEHRGNGAPARGRDAILGHLALDGANLAALRKTQGTAQYLRRIVCSPARKKSRHDRIVSLMRSSKPSAPHSSVIRCTAAASGPCRNLPRQGRRAGQRCNNSAWRISSGTSKRDGTLASNGNKCSSRSQNAWIVWIFRPPGVSSVRAKSFRAAANCWAPGIGAPVATIRPPRSSSASCVQSASLSNTRAAMFAAAALVKVRQRIFEGATPCRRSRTTRLASTCVLPDPALAETQTDWFGFDALCCLPSVPAGISKDVIIIRRPLARRPATIP